MRLLPALLALVLAVPAMAEDPVKDGVPVALPGRPTISNPANLPPTGYLQFEQGVVVLGNAPGIDYQISLQQTVKVALSKRWLIFEQALPVSETWQSGPTSRDFGGIAIGAQYVIAGPDRGNERVPSIAVGYFRSLNDGTAPGYDSGGSEQGAVLLASGSVFKLHYDANFQFNEQVENGDRHLQTAQTLSVTGNLTAKTSLTGELWHFTRPLDGGHAAGSLWAYAYTPRPNLVLDIGFNRGITPESAHWYGLFGFTYVLPHRLWHQRGR